MKYESQYYGVVQMEDIIEHHGIKGMKWGIRRYQNPDGTLTAAGRARYLTDLGKGKASIDDTPDSEAKNAYRKAREEHGKFIKADHDLRNEFWSSDSKTIDKYVLKDADESWKEWKDTWEKQGKTQEDYRKWYLHGDGEQGGAEEIWLREKHADHLKNFKKAGETLTNAKKNLVKEIVGEHSGKKVKAKTRSYDWNKRKWADHWEDTTVDDLVNRQIDFMDSPDNKKKKRAWR